VVSGVLVIGVGNGYRRDDAAGLVVARRVREEAPGGVSVLEHSGEGAGLVEAWAGADAVILIDAVQTGSPPGTLYRLDAHVEPIPARFFHYSTHAFSIAEAIELARALGELPRRLIVHGIEGEDFQAGEGLSRRVADAVEEVLQRVLQDIERIQSLAEG
jgi:hydrogenase maturation protease